MKKTLVLFLLVCGIVLTSSIQAKNLDNINGAWQNKNSQSLTTTQDISDPGALNTKDTFSRFSLIILVIVGFFFAVKHQDLTKEYRDLAKKH